MNYTQNKKIEQVSESTISVGVDIGSELNFARAFDWRGVEVTKKAFKFGNDIEGFKAFSEWMDDVLGRTAKSELIVGCEPTGHYWFPLARYLKERKIRLVIVNP